MPSSSYGKKPKSGQSTQVDDPAGMKGAFKTPVGHTKVDEDPNSGAREGEKSDEGGGLGARIVRGIKKRIGS